MACVEKRSLNHLGTGHRPDLKWTGTQRCLLWISHLWLPVTMRTLRRVQGSVCLQLVFEESLVVFPKGQSADNLTFGSHPAHLAKNLKTARIPLTCQSQA